MKCDRCNFENPENESYCINCGQKLPEKPMVTHIIVKFSNKIPENNENNNYYSVTYRGPDNTEINDTAYGCIKKTMKDNKKLFIAIILNFNFITPCLNIVLPNQELHPLPAFLPVLCHRKTHDVLL